MKIIRHNDGELVLRDNRISALIVSGFIIVFGIGLGMAEQWLIATFLLIIGVVAIVFNKSVETQCDKSVEKVFIRSTSLAKKSFEEISFDQIAAVKIVQLYEDERGDEEYEYFLALVLTDGRKIRLQQGDDEFHGKDPDNRLHRRYQELASTVANFLGVEVIDQLDDKRQVLADFHQPPRSQ